MSYSVTEIIGTDPDSTVSLRYKSKLEFCNLYESSFLVLPDGKTIIGSYWRNQMELIAEDITTNKVTHIGTLTNRILTVLYDPKTLSLFAGDESGHLHQYKHQKNGDSGSFLLVKNYGDIGLGGLESSELVGDLAVFGGTEKSLGVVDVRKKELVKGTFETAFKWIHSLQVCKVSKTRTLLSVGGYDPSYSNSLSDIFEVKTGICDDPVTLVNDQ